MTVRGWTYHVEIVERIDVSALNGLGSEGWELVAVLPLDGSRTELVFKRPAPDFRTRITLDQRAEATDSTRDADEATP